MSRNFKRSANSANAALEEVTLQRALNRRSRRLGLENRHWMSNRHLVSLDPAYNAALGVAPMRTPATRVRGKPDHVPRAS
jgi:hypothetical protein